MLSHNILIFIFLVVLFLLVGKQADVSIVSFFVVSLASYSED